MSTSSPPHHVCRWAEVPDLRDGAPSIKNEWEAIRDHTGVISGSARCAMLNEHFVFHLQYWGGMLQQKRSATDWKNGIFGNDVREPFAPSSTKEMTGQSSNEAMEANGWNYHARRNYYILNSPIFLSGNGTDNYYLKSQKNNSPTCPITRSGV